MGVKPVVCEECRKETANAHSMEWVAVNKKSLTTAATTTSTTTTTLYEDPVPFTISVCEACFAVRKRAAWKQLGFLPLIVLLGTVVFFVVALLDPRSEVTAIGLALIGLGGIGLTAGAAYLVRIQIGQESLLSEYAKKKQEELGRNCCLPAERFESLGT